MRSLLVVLLLWLLPGPALGQDMTDVRFVKANGRLSVEAVVQNRTSSDVTWDLSLKLQPAEGGQAVTVRKSGVRVRAGESRKVRFATALRPEGEPQLNTCLARSGSGKACVYIASVRLHLPAAVAVAAPQPSPVAASSPGVLVIASQRFQNGKPNGELVARITLQNDGGQPASTRVRLLFRDVRGEVLDRSAEARNVPPGERRELIIRTGLHCPDRIDTSGGSVHIRNIQVVGPAQVRGSYDPESGDAIYRYYPPSVKITEGFYAIEVRLER